MSDNQLSGESTPGDPRYALTQMKASLVNAAAIEAAKARVAQLRKEIEDADRECMERSKPRRAEMRNDNRRAQIVGHVVLQSCLENPERWEKIWPRVENYLQGKSAEDRALFNLLPQPTADSAMDDKSSETEKPKRDAIASKT